MVQEQRLGEIDSWQSYIKNLLAGIDLLTMPAWIKEIKYSSPCRMVAMSANRMKLQQPRRRRSMLYIYIHFNFDDMMKKPPNARMAHPWPNRFYPLHVALGAAGERAKAELILLFCFFFFLCCMFWGQVLDCNYLFVGFGCCNLFLNSQLLKVA
ncbi:uncharacterized protein LOC121971986 [Zingiber officinale]|uniref:uncharacterized protein LOC121971986 n=1 Tax=Zingiber officinale TaxID=94328 RepID=UPI001C4BDCA8|nr:uncharacterized protein LOC121971986 [Zingiber officinale]